MDLTARAGSGHPWRTFAIETQYQKATLRRDRSRHRGVETMTQQATVPATPGGNLQYSRMPGHWLLARMGKRVLRPGGIELTRQMLDALNIGTSDEVVEFAPGLGVTARATLGREPRSYTGIERDEAAAKHVRGYLSGESRQCLVGRAEKTGLPDGSASVIYGEAMLTMQTAVQKARRLIRDEGLPRALRFIWNVARTPAARKRIRAMHGVFRRYADHLAATAIVAVKG